MLVAPDVRPVSVAPFVFGVDGMELTVDLVETICGSHLDSPAQCAPTLNGKMKRSFSGVRLMRGALECRTATGLKIDLQMMLAS
jgi:hypothetical protein